MSAEIFTCSLVAYGFARFRFPGRNIIFLIMLSTMMLPGVVTLVPQFIMWRELKLIDTYDPLVLGAWFAWGPSYIFLLRQFFLSIPREIEEAAVIDGANPIQIYWQIMLPLIKPALLAIAVLSFIGNWNNFLGPLIYLNTGEKYPMIMALKFFEQSLSKEAPLFHYMMAMSTIMSIPLLALLLPDAAHSDRRHHGRRGQGISNCTNTTNYATSTRFPSSGAAAATAMPPASHAPTEPRT